MTWQIYGVGIMCNGHAADFIAGWYSQDYNEDIPMIELDRITQDPAVMGGKACIRGMRVTVGMIVGQIGSGHSVEELLADYPYLEREDVLQALRYAAWLAQGSEGSVTRSHLHPHSSSK
jgi:uncharacterized protein (DUF433 family)